MSMNELETEGIVIASREYRERDLLVTLLTPSGRHALHARGTLKVDSRNAGALQLGTRGSISCTAAAQAACFRCVRQRSRTAIPPSAAPCWARP